MDSFRNDNDDRSCSRRSSTSGSSCSDDDYHQPEDDYYNNSRNIDRPSFRPSTPSLTDNGQQGAKLNHSRSQSREFSFDEGGTANGADGGTPATHTSVNNNRNNDNAHFRSLSQGSYNSLSQGSHTGSYAQSRSRESYAHSFNTRSHGSATEEENDVEDEDDNSSANNRHKSRKNDSGLERNVSSRSRIPKYHDDESDHSSRTDTSASSSTGAGDGTHNEHVQVFLRLRPMNKLELARRSRNCIELHEDTDDYVQHNAKSSRLKDTAALSANALRRCRSSPSRSPHRRHQKQSRRRSSRLGSFSDSEEEDTTDDEERWRDDDDEGGDDFSVGSKSAIQMNPKSLTVDSPLDGQFYEFTFDDIFDANAKQRTVYDSAARGIVRDFARGYNGCIVTYGQTSTGKTHTLLGTDEYVKDQLTSDRVGISQNASSTTNVAVATQEMNPERKTDTETEGKTDEEEHTADYQVNEHQDDEKPRETASEQQGGETEINDAEKNDDNSSPPPSISIPSNNAPKSLDTQDANNVVVDDPLPQPSSQHCMANDEFLTEESGIIPRAIHDLFEMIRRGPPEMEYVVKCSYVELYLEKFWDLLDPTQPDGTLKHLRLGTNSGTGRTRGESYPQNQTNAIDGVSEACCLNERDVLALLVKGNACRQLSREHMFCDDNKSHTIFTVRLHQTNGITGSTKLSTLTLVDLAGSEFATRPEEDPSPPPTQLIRNSFSSGAAHRASMVRPVSRATSVTGSNVNAQALHTARHLIQTNPASHSAAVDDDENEEDTAALIQAAAQHEQNRFMEAKLVHKSLSALNRVVMALADDEGDSSLLNNNNHNYNGNEREETIPYRYSKLTQYLKQALGGNCRTAIVLTASSSQYNIQESLQTFRFGEDAREIWNRGVKMNEYPCTAWYERKLLSMQQKHIQLVDILRQVRDECLVTGRPEEDDIEEKTVTERWDGDEGKSSLSNDSKSALFKDRSLNSSTGSFPFAGAGSVHHKKLLDSINRVIEQEENDVDKENSHLTGYPLHNHGNHLGYNLRPPEEHRHGDGVDDDSYMSDNEKKMAPNEEIAFLRRKLKETERQRNQAEQNVAELQSEVVILKNQTHHAKEDCRDFLRQIRNIKKEHQMMQQKRTELEHKLRTSMFRESETTVFFRQFRRFYRRLLKHKAAQGSIGGDGTSDVKEIIGKVPGVPDLSDLIDVDTLLYEAGLIEESERFDDSAAFTFRPSRKSLSLSYKAARRASKRRSAPAHASSLSYAAEMAAKQDQGGAGTNVEHAVTGRRSKSDGMQASGTSEMSTVNTTRQTSIPEDNATTDDSCLPPMQRNVATTSSQDDDDGTTEASSVASSVTQSIHRASVGGGTTNVHWTSAREEQLQEEVTKLTEKCIKLQIALTDEKSKWDSITDDSGTPLNVRKLQLKTAALKTELDKKSNDLEAVIWKMNELHLINKTYGEKVSNREQNVSYLEQTLSDVQSQCRKILTERHENEEAMSKELEELQGVIDSAFRLPLWQFDEAVADDYHGRLVNSTKRDKQTNNDMNEDGDAFLRTSYHPSCSRNLQSRIRVSLRGGEEPVSSTLEEEEKHQIVKDGKVERQRFVEEELSAFAKMPVETCNVAMQTEEPWPDIEAVRSDAIASLKKEAKEESVQTETAVVQDEGESNPGNKKNQKETLCIGTQTEEEWPTKQSYASPTQIGSALTAPETASIAIQTDECIVAPKIETTSVSIQTDSCDQECVGTQTESLPQHEVATQTDLEKKGPEMMDVAIQTEERAKAPESKSISIQTEESGDHNPIVQNDSPVDVRDIENVKTDSTQEKLRIEADSKSSRAVESVEETNLNENIVDASEMDTTASLAISISERQVRSDHDQEDACGELSEHRQCTIENSTTNSYQPASPMRSSSKGKSKESSKERRKRERRKNKTVDVVPPEELVVPMGEDDEVSLLTSQFGGVGGHTDAYLGGKPSTFVPKRFAPKLGLAIKPGVVRHHHNSKRNILPTKS